MLSNSGVSGGGMMTDVDRGGGGGGGGLSVHHVRCMMEHALRNTYTARPNDVESEAILNNCIMLFAKDYKYSIMENSNGELCGHYPTRIVLLEYTVSGQQQQQQNNVESFYDMTKLQTLIKGARSARCRGRFVAPVILFEGKHICRSATLSGGAEIYGRQVVGMLVNSRDIVPSEMSPPNTASDSSDWQMFSIVRNQDIKLLKTLNVGFIFDLMVEKKKVKFGLNVTSSEKVDKENRYSDFQISSIPYPGCEFFREWKDANYKMEGMIYDWSQDFVDTQLDIPTIPSPPTMINWSSYMSWDVVQLTQNYLLLLLKTIKEANTGILIHCISGWDRTPLFISLIRLSLWAEGLIHESLNALEILYLTVAYDWFLFGHKFPDRSLKGEEIFYFCFDFLRYITGDEFNIGHNSDKKLKTRNVSSTDSISRNGPLLDFEVSSEEQKECRASTSSLNSVCSLQSNENPSISFSIGSCEEDNLIGSSVPRRKTSPVAVPRPVHQLQTEAKSVSISDGSWQLIPSLDSYRESRTSSPFFHSLAANSSRGSLPEISSNFNPNESTRKLNLKEVRRIFLQLYPSIASQSAASWSIGGGSGFSSLFENLAEKVGIRSARSSFV